MDGGGNAECESDYQCPKLYACMQTVCCPTADLVGHISDYFNKMILGLQIAPGSRISVSLGACYKILVQRCTGDLRSLSVLWM